MTLNVENLDRLISHLEGLPENKFSIRYLSVIEECGTVACIAGWCNFLEGNKSEGVYSAGDWLGLGSDDYVSLFCPDQFSVSPELYPLPRAIRTLKHMRSEFMRTGEVVVDWDAPEPVEKPAWAAPKAVERVLPEEIVSLLRPAQRSEVSA